MSNVIRFPKSPAAAPVVPQETPAIVVDETVPVHIAGTVKVMQLIRGLSRVGLQLKFDPRKGALLIHKLRT